MQNEARTSDKDVIFKWQGEDEGVSLSFNFRKSRGHIFLAILTLFRLFWPSLDWGWGGGGRQPFPVS